MPKMGGIEFFKSICDADSKARYPVIVLTARANLEDLFKKLDVSGFMTKPFRIDELAAEIEIVLSIKDRETAAAQHEGKVAKKVIVIENDREVFDRMAVALLNEGYIVGYAPTSMDGVEKMLGNPPDAALIKLGMEDIPGYILISKLKNIAKTRDVKFVLYTPASDRLNIAVMEKICRDIGIKNFVASDYPDELIEELKKAGV
jgi:DNA-binding response OmpR family regulator